MGHRTAEVYAWSKRTGIFASRGVQGRKAQPVTTRLDEQVTRNPAAMPTAWLNAGRSQRIARVPVWGSALFKDIGY